MQPKNLLSPGELPGEMQKEAKEFITKMKAKYSGADFIAAVKINTLMGILRVACSQGLRGDAEAHAAFHAQVETPFADLCEFIIESVRANGDNVKNAIIEFAAFNEHATDMLNELRSGAMDSTKEMATAAIHKASKI